MDDINRLLEEALEGFEEGWRQFQGEPSGPEYEEALALFTQETLAQLQGDPPPN